VLDLISYGIGKRSDETTLSTTSKESYGSSPHAFSQENKGANARKDVAVPVAKEPSGLVPRISISLDTSPVFAERSAVHQQQAQNTRVSSETSRSHTSEASILPTSQTPATGSLKPTASTTRSTRSSTVNSNSNTPSTTLRVVNGDPSPSNSNHDQTRTVPVSPVQSLSARKPSTSSLVSQSSTSSSVYSQPDDTPATIKPRQFSIARKSLPSSATTTTAKRGGSFDVARTGRGGTSRDEGNGSSESAVPRRLSYEPPRNSRDEFGSPQGYVNHIRAQHTQHIQHYNWHRRAQNIHQRNHQQNHHHHQQQQQQQHRPPPHHHPHPQHSPYHHHHHQQHQQNRHHHQQPITDIGRGRSRLFVYQPRVEPPHISVSAASDPSTYTSFSLPQLPGLEDCPPPVLGTRARTTAATPTTTNKPTSTNANVPRLRIDAPLLSSEHSQGPSKGSTSSSAGKEKGKRDEEFMSKRDGDGGKQKEKESAAAAWQRRTRMFQMEDPNAHLRLRMVPG